MLAYQRKASRLVAGVMSGTSLDGIDVAFVEIAGSGPSLRQAIRGFHSQPYAEDLRQRLFAACSGDFSIREGFELDVDLGGVYADAILSATDACSIDPHSIDAIGLHGQTVYHAPRRASRGVSVQLGSAAVVAERLRTIVVNDFRAADVAAGGEGAPFVPYCDLVLLHSTSLHRVALNIGGIANFTWLPRAVNPALLIAFDTGPGNLLIDAAMRRLFGREVDENGEVAARGTADAAWVQELLADPFFKRRPPKSAGREQFGKERGTALVAEALKRGLANEGIIASLTLLTARSIAQAIRDFASKGDPVDEIVVSGGGVHNSTLLDMLGGEMKESRILPSDDLGIPADAKEALCFAILANETLCETPANVPSVTGARRPVICGTIRLGKTAVNPGVETSR
jgi:anhydro-N-acetylmuramic acid kinase